MTRTDLWRERYRADPYLQHLSFDELVQRLDDVFQNVIKFSHDGKYGLHSPGVADDDRDDGDHDRGRWIIRMDHLFEEFRRREIGILRNSAILDRVSFLKRRYPRVPQAAAVWERAGPVPYPYLVKLGKRCHLEAMLATGLVRVAPASEYAKDSFNHAIRDSELELAVHLRNATVTRLDGAPMPVIGDVKMTTRLDWDYYVWCASFEFDYRLFDDFDADACLLIRDPQSFLGRLRDAFMFQVPTEHYRRDVVKYFDPLRPFKNYEITFTKHLRYAYQQEFRAMFLPYEKKKEYDQPVFLSLGSLAPSCELLTLWP